MKILYRLTLLSFLVVICVTACRRDQRSLKGGDIIIRLSKEPDRLHPLIFPNPTAREVYQYIFAPIADYDPISLDLTPILIKDIPEVVEHPDGKISYTLEFREEATWDDGSPVTAEDYLFTLKAVLHPGTQATAHRGFISNIADVVLYPDNPRKITIFYDEYYMLARETAIYLEVYPEKIYDPNFVLKNISFSEFKNKEILDEFMEKDTSFLKFADDFNSAYFSREMVSGAGPYRLAYWEANQTIVLERKENYWGDKLNISYLKNNPDKIIFQVIPDEVAALIELKRDGLDVIMNLSAEAFEQLKSDTVFASNFDFFTPQLIRYYHIILNTKHPILQDKSVRRALAHMIDVDDLIQRIEYGHGLRVAGPINPAKAEYNEQLKLPEFNLENAKSILAFKGWSDMNGNGILDKRINDKLVDLELDLYITGSDLAKVIGSQLQSNAAKCGVKINVITKDFSLTRTENLNTGNFAMIPNVASQDLGLDDPYSRFHSDNAKPGGSNYSLYESAVADSLIQLIRTVKSTPERIRLFKEFQQVIYEDQPYIFLYVPMGRLVVSKRWQGFGTPKRPGYMANIFTHIPVMSETKPN